ncbi:MAG: MBL fold metallo-hydrolase, partial [Prevotella sp.]|nr:MBL fold metallo-hydrolase [Prevotella sp.]
MTDITKDIIYIGQDDKDLTLFESQYDLPEGMCYNSFVIKDEKTAVMDTSDQRTMVLWLEDLQKALDGGKPDYLVVHHIEPDHASGIGQMLQLYPEMKLVCSARAASMIPLYFPNANIMDRVMTVKEGETLELGKHVLQFIMAPMVHWPEVMTSYDLTDKVLFSADAFGKFGVRDADPDDWACEARRYYFNICGKYGAPVSALMMKISELEIEQICPLHGPILKGKAMEEALRLYGIWSSYGIEAEGVFIAYASIHGCTKEAAELLSAILKG